MSLKSMLEKRAREFLTKSGFQPMPGGQPPQDPNAQQGGGAQGGMPPQGGQPGMDPSQMGGQPGGMPMDPSMMGGMGGGMGGMGMGMPPMDPSMMAQTATIGSLSITDYQAVMTDMLTNVLQQIVPSLIQEIRQASQGSAGAGQPDPSQVAPQEDGRGISNTEISEKLDAVMAALAQFGGGAPAGGEMPPEMAGPGAGAPPPAAAGAEMGFGGTGFGGQPAMAGGQPGMEVQAGARPGRRNALADTILRKTALARKG